MSRKTSFSSKRIINLLTREEHEYPTGMLINELGIILKEEGDEGSEIENFLLSLLDDRKENHRAIAFCWLADIKEVADRNSEILLEFRNRPENEDIIEVIDEALGN